MLLGESFFFVFFFFLTFFSSFKEANRYHEAAFKYGLNLTGEQKFRKETSTEGDARKPVSAYLPVCGKGVCWCSSGVGTFFKGEGGGGDLHFIF